MGGKAGKPSTKTKDGKGGEADAQKGRRVIHPELYAVWHLSADGNPVDEAAADEIMGYEAEKSEGDFGDDFFAAGPGDVKWRANNNANADYTNRPLSVKTAEEMSEKILGGEWEPNGETVIVGRTGLVLDGQTRLWGYKLACLKWKEDRESGGRLYGERWPDSPPVLQTLIAYGVDESPKTIRTIGICRARSMADVIYQSRWFEKVRRNGKEVRMSREAKVTCAKLTAHAVAMLWDHMAAGVTAGVGLHTRKTKGAELTFIENHPRLLEAVKTIYELYRPNWRVLSSQLSPGYAAAALYLMAASDADGAEYRRQNPRREGKGKSAAIGFSQWEKAVQFWEEFCGLKGDFHKVKEAIATAGVVADRATREQRVAVICKAWKEWLDNKGKINAGRIRLEIEEDQYGRRRYKDFPTFGGIDVGHKGVADDVQAGDPDEFDDLDDEFAAEEAGKKAAELLAAQKKKDAEKAAAEKERKKKKKKRPSKSTVPPVDTSLKDEDGFDEDERRTAAELDGLESNGDWEAESDETVLSKKTFGKPDHDDESLDADLEDDEF